ncbi:LysR family substrate-binding domain-containing protein [Streptomyces sp. NPDC049906]|uniref:LysR family substrate-binding domain-containing protein n=1 Tax=Streptomyces sp. NPDC049906 TaxID=3155656 RepID=UPI003442A066
MTDVQPPAPFRLAYVPGVTPAKWVRVWTERLPEVPLSLVPVPAAEALALLREGGADTGLVRLPVDGEDLSAIPLYTETTVVVVPKDHLVTAVDEVAPEDLAEELVLHPVDDVLDWERPPGVAAKERPATTADAIELVAAGVGLLAVPQSLARLHHRRDLTYRPLKDAPESRVALSWPKEATTDLVEEFIGIVRGRTVNSWRGRGAAQPAPERKPAAARGSRKGASTGKASGGQRGAGSGRGGAGKNTGGARGGRSGRPRRRG